MPNFTPVGVIAEVKNLGKFTSDMGKMDKATQNTAKSATTAGKQMTTASQGANSFGASIKSWGASLVGPALLTTAIAGVSAGIKASIELSKEQARVEGQLDAVLKSTAGAAGLNADQIKKMAGALQQTTNYGDEAIIGGQNLLLTFTNIGSDVFPRATQAMLDVSTAMGQDIKTSAIQLGKALNDPLTGLTALQRVGITFTDEQEKLIKSFSKAGETAKAQEIILGELERQFGGSAAAAREADGGTIALSNAMGDLGEAVGDMIVPFVRLTNEGLIPLVNRMESGADSWRWIIEMAGELNGLEGGLLGSATAAKATQDATKGLLGVFNPLAGITGELGSLYVSLYGEEEALAIASKKEAQATIEAAKARVSAIEASQEAIDATEKEAEALSQTEIMAQKYGVSVRGTADNAIDAYWDRADAAKKTAEEEAKAFQESLKAQQEMVLGIKSTQAGYYNELAALQGEALTSEADFINELGSIRTDGATRQQEEAQKLTDELANLEQERQDKLHWVMTGAHERTEQENAEALAYWNSYYDELTTTAQTKSAEQTDAIIAEQGRAEAAANAARQKEKAAMEAHLEELKLKTTLSMLETTGQLEQLTGLVGISAGEAAELISAGVLPVTQELGMAIQGTMEGMETSMANATATATANQDILHQALTGTLQGAQALTPELERIGGPFEDLSNETMPTTQENATMFFENLGLMTDTYTQGPVTAMDTKFVNFNTLTLPTTQMTYQTSFQIMIDVTNQLIATVNELLMVIAQIATEAQAAADAVKKAADEMKEGFHKAAKTIEDELISILAEVIRYLERVEVKAHSATQAIAGIPGIEGAAAGAGVGIQSGIGFSRGIGLQEGLGLGWTVPSGYPNDSFGPLFVESGEQVLVTPRGSSIDSVVMDRLSSMPVQTSMTNYYFNMTVNTGADAQSVIQQYEVMRAMLPN